ncbi:tRNA glutamyl-Q(34) synthetase GluQRS [Altererythrobacter aquiaggeris]|uniref:tRNA glutamyl-Q(34) synthetase GluQRS n=1 Tax=Aestuarierythrobacter aquiaggeris TaxID=1898396 RepID=UPI0030162806
MVVTRFAPSPNGALHLGHAFSAIIAHDLAREADGKFILRIEDIDGARSRPELAGMFRDDLRWLGLDWDEVPPQSARIERYDAAGAVLKKRGLLYPCICTRSEVLAASIASGPDGPVYPGTCKGRDVPASGPVAWRMDVQRALAECPPLTWHDRLAGTQECKAAEAGDVVLFRKDAPASYHLAATIDDADDGVTLVTRGADLFAASHIHRLVQKLLGLAVPTWYHHDLLLDESGQKLAKSRNSPSLADRRLGGQDGKKLADRLRSRNFPAGISPGRP